MDEEDSKNVSDSTDIVKGEFVGKYTTPTELTEFVVPVSILI